MRIMEARKNIFFAAALGLCALATGIPAKAQQPPSLPSIVRDAVEASRKDCEDVSREGFVVVKDVNGDGINDYILDYGKCHSDWCGSSGCRPQCGSSGCWTQVFASQPNGTFALVLDENVRGRSQARTWCVSSKATGVSLDLRISGCSTLILSGTLSNNDLALAYSNRGSAYSDKGQFKRASQDYDQASKLGPNFDRAYYRGLARAKKGDKARGTGIPLPSIKRDAIRDYIEASKANCDESVVFRKGFVVVKDVNGDGIKDYILDYGKFQCGDRLGEWCGSSGCHTEVFASLPDGTLAMVLAENMRGLRFARVKGRPAMLLDLYRGACNEPSAAKQRRCIATLFWDGSRFKCQGAKCQSQCNLGVCEQVPRFWPAGR